MKQVVSSYTSCFSSLFLPSSALCFHTCPSSHVLNQAEGPVALNWLIKQRFNSIEMASFRGVTGSRTNTIPSKARVGAQAKAAGHGGRQGGTAVLRGRTCLC